MIGNLELRSISDDRKLRTDSIPGDKKLKPSGDETYSKSGFMCNPLYTKLSGVVLGEEMSALSQLFSPHTLFCIGKFTNQYILYQSDTKLGVVAGKVILRLLIVLKESFTERTVPFFYRVVTNFLFNTLLVKPLGAHAAQNHW